MRDEKNRVRTVAIPCCRPFADASPVAIALTKGPHGGYSYKNEHIWRYVGDVYSYVRKGRL